MKSSVSCVDLPVIQSVIPVQNDPAPTAAGIRSEASNRNWLFGSCRVSTTILVRPVYSVGSTLRFALAMPVLFLARLVA